MVTAELVDVIEYDDGQDDPGNLGIEKFWFEETHSSLVFRMGMSQVFVNVNKTFQPIIDLHISCLNGMFTAFLVIVYNRFII